MDEAVSLTWSTLTRRLKNLRYGAIAAGLGLAALIFAGIFLRLGWLLAGLPLFSLLGYFFFRRDQKLVFAWEDRVLALWAEEKLVMGLFVLTFDNHPGALSRTLKGMVALLPRNADYLPPAAGEICAERRLFWTRSALHEVRLQKAAALNLGLAAFPCALWLLSGAGGIWLPLALLPPALILPAQAWAVSQTRRRWHRRNSAIAPWKPDPPESFTARLDGLDWSKIPKSLRAHLYAAAGGIGTRT